MFRRRKGLIIWYQYTDKDGKLIQNHYSFTTSEKATYAHVFDEMYDDLKGEFGKDFFITNVIKL